MASSFDPIPQSIQFLASPILYAIRPLYAALSSLRPAPQTRLSSQSPIRVVCISDTHNLHDTLQSVPDGDILIHAGDLTDGGTRAEIQAAIDWLKKLPHAHKVVVSGNHDSWFDKDVRTHLPDPEDQAKDLDWGEIHYLQNAAVTLSIHSRSLVVHGIPQIPCLNPSPPSPSNLHAFQYLPETSTPYPEPPPSTDILIAHSPAAYHLDNFPCSPGSTHLLSTLWAIKPALFVHGHVHMSPGIERAYYDSAQRRLEGMMARRRESGEVWERKGAGRGVWWWVFTQAGVWKDLLGVRAWWDAVCVVLGVVRGLLGRRKGVGKEGWIVNAARLDGRGSGRLIGNGVVVDI